jgi:hypothetical protein
MISLELFISCTAVVLTDLALQAIFLVIELSVLLAGEVTTILSGIPLLLAPNGVILAF